MRAVVQVVLFLRPADPDDVEMAINHALAVVDPARIARSAQVLPTGRLVDSAIENFLLVFLPDDPARTEEA